MMPTAHMLQTKEMSAFSLRGPTSIVYLDIVGCFLTGYTYIAIQQAYDAYRRPYIIILYKLLNALNTSEH